MTLSLTPHLWDGPADDEDLLSGEPVSQRIDPATGALEIEMPDGSVTINFNPPSDDEDDEEDPDNWNNNLAEKIDEMELDRIATEVIEGIEADMESRKEWLDTISRGIDLLGIKLEKPRADIGSSAPLEGMSTVRHPLLLEACLRGQANARGELLPVDGPVKIENDGEGTTLTDEMAEALEKDMNAYLTKTATEYYPDTDRMLFKVWAYGMQFKKVYYCPMRQRPVSETVDVKDIIVSDNTTDLANSGRHTHEIIMRPNVLKRMQLLGVYRDVGLSEPQQGTPNAVTIKEQSVAGVRPTNKRPQDQDYTIYESYVELDIEGFEHKRNGKPTGLALPYRVTIERDSRKVLDIRRNWRKSDEQCLAKEAFVPYEFVPGLGFYAMGLIHILGNTTTAVTAAWREMLDAYMFANFPGFVRLKSAGTRQMDNNFRVAPGGAVELDAGSSDDIRKIAMPLPYKEPGPAMVQFIDNIIQTGQRLGSTAETSVGEGKQDAPVGTTLALLEQAQKLIDAVHKRLHTAQSKEFQLLRDLFAEHPECLMRNKKKQWKWDAQILMQALQDFDLSPQADPNTPSHVHRLMKTAALVQIAKEAPPGTFDLKKVTIRALRTIGVDDYEDLFAPPPPPGAAPPSPEQLKMMELQLKQQDLGLKQQQIARQDVNQSRLIQDRQQDRQATMNEKILDLAKELAVHSDQQSQAASDRALSLMQSQNQDRNAAIDRAVNIANAHRDAQNQQANAFLDRQHALYNAEQDRQHAMYHAEQDRAHAMHNAHHDRTLEAWKIDQQAKQKAKQQAKPKQRVQ